MMMQMTVAMVLLPMILVRMDLWSDYSVDLSKVYFFDFLTFGFPENQHKSSNFRNCFDLSQLFVLKKDLEMVYGVTF